MSYSIQRAVSDGTLAVLPISIEYFDRSEISVLFDGVVNARQWAWVGTTDSTISFTPPVANTVEVSVKRNTDISELRHAFSDGAQFTTNSLDESLIQVLHIAQEAKEGSGLGEVYQDLNFHGFKATNMGSGSNPGDAVNHAQMEVHDATIIGYRNECEVFAAQAELAAASVTLPIPISSGGTGASTASAARVSLGLGNAATQTMGTGSGQIPTSDQVATLANPSTATQVEMETGTEVGLRMMSPLRVKQASVAVIDAYVIGHAQTIQTLTGSRALNTTYYNTTGRAILVYVQCGSPTGVSVLIDGVETAGESMAYLYAQTYQFLVPAGSNYKFNITGGSLVWWKELR